MNKEPYYFYFKLFGLACVALIIMVFVAVLVPRQFPEGTRVHIAQKSGLSKTADTLTSKNIIASPFLFKAVVVLLHGHNRIAAGDYQFDKPQNLWTVVGRLMRGEQGLTAIKVTIPEGSTVEDIAWILMRKIPDFNAPLFLKIAKGYEGYLFPDTYFFYPNSTPEEISNALRKNFDTQFRTLLLETSLSGRKPADVVTMASIIEREAASSTERAIISGILWKRLDEKMPLQVDATLVYITGNAYTSIADTKIDSPYNTYKYKGLPKGPISNPGLDALRAAVKPVTTKYYYYLSDKKGVTHYAATFEGHQVNRGKYLNK